MSSEKVRNKDITNFHRLCKDLYKYIQKRILRKYVNPNMQGEPLNILGTLISQNKEWKYFNTKEKLTEEEKILDIFKDNSFLAKLKTCYEALEIVVNTMDENQKNVELLQKDIELGGKKLELLSRLNIQLNQLFNLKEGSGTQIHDNQKTNKDELNNVNNNSNSLDRLNIVKSLNILNDLKIFGNMNNDRKEESNKCIKNNNNTSNTTITNNNNIILDNKIINNNIRDTKLDLEKDHLPLNEEKSDINNNNNNNPNSCQKSGKKKKKKSSHNNNNNTSTQNIQNPLNCDMKLLNRKSQRDNIYPPEEEKVSDAEINPEQSIIKSNNSLINPTFQNSNDSLNIRNSPEIEIEPKSNNFNNDTANNNLDIPLSYNSNINETNNNNNSEQENNNNSDIYYSLKLPNESSDITSVKEEKKEPIENLEGNTLEIEFEKVLKEKFFYVYDKSATKMPKMQKDILCEINQILKKIPTLKFNRKNKFDDPYVVGSYAHFDAINLMDYPPPVDIMFKCKNIKSMNELSEIALETMKKKMNFTFLELNYEYNKKNEMVKFRYKCKITKGGKDKNIFYIFFNIFFVGVNLSNFNQKEQCVNRFYFNNSDMYDSSGKILISLYFRRWRRKYDLLFIMPEFLDIIINFYYCDKKYLSVIIEEIFFDLFNCGFSFLDGKNNKEKKDMNVGGENDVENLKEIKKIIMEWYTDEENKQKMCNAIRDTQELIVNSKFYLSFSSDNDE